MAFEADRVVVEVIAKLDQLDQPVKQSAAQFDANMGKMEASAGKLESTIGKTTIGAKEFAKALSAAGGDLKKVSIGASEATSKVAGLGQGIDKATRFGQRHATALQSQRAGMTQLGFQFQDIGQQAALGVRPMTIFAQQGGQVIQALQLMNSGGNRFLAFLAGPWGIGLSVAAVALSPLIAKLFEAKEGVGDLVEELKENVRETQLAGQANAAFQFTIEGVTQAILDDEEALKKLNDANVTAAQQALINARLRQLTLQQIRDETAAVLDNARAHLEAEKAKSIGFGGRGSSTAFELAQLEVAKSLKEIDRLEQRIGRIDRLIERQTAKVTQALAFRVVELAQKQADPLEAIKQKYEGAGGLIDQARKRAIAEGTVSTELAKQIRLLTQQQAAEEKAYRDSQRRAKQPALPPVTGKEIARALGTTINPGGGFRTPAQNRAVDGAANSYHLSGQAIDIPLTVNGKPLTKAGIRAALEPLGVQIKELLGPGDKGHADHFHIAFAKRRLGGDQVARARERAEQQALRLADQEERREQAFQNEKASLQTDELQARQALITSAEEIAKLELQSIEISRAKYQDNVNSLEAQRKLTADEAKELIALNNERAKLRAELVQRREDERRFRLQEQQNQAGINIETARLQNQAEVLQGAQDLVTTQRARRDIERRLLDLQYQEERIRLDAIIAYNERLKLNKNAQESERIEAEAAAAIAKIRLESLGQRQASAQARSDRANASPLQSYFGDIAAQGDDLNSMFESVAAGGLRTFTDALTDAIVNFKSLGDVGRAVLQSVTADLVRLAIQQILLHTVGKALGMTAIAATSAQAAAAAAAWAPAAAAASLATLGANAGPAAAALASTNALATALALPKGFQSGGYTGSGPTGSAAGIVHGQEYVFDAAATRRIGVPALDAMRNGRISPMNARAASPSGRSGFASGDIQQLEGIIGRAIEAMPAISLHPTLHPAAALKAALDTVEGRRFMFEFMGANASGVKAQLG